MTTRMHAPISIGELFDRVIILTIKADRITDPIKLANINNELTSMTAVLNDFKREKELHISFIEKSLKALININMLIWNAEDELREKERQKMFDDEFIQYARSVYINNDIRTGIKCTINRFFYSSIIDEKSYHVEATNDHWS